MTAGVVLAVLAVVFLGAAAQALSGFGFNLLITPLLAALVGPKPAVVGASLLALVLSAFQAVKWRPLADIPLARIVLVGSLVGMPIGLLVLRELPADALMLTIAAVVVVSAVLIAAEVSLPTHHRYAPVAAGAMSGALATSTGMSGPPLVVLMQRRSGSPAAFRATLAVIFAFTGVVSVLLFAVGGQLSGKAVATALAGLPGLALGFWIGDHGFRRIPAHRFKLVVVTMLFLSAAVAMAKALT